MTAGTPSQRAVESLRFKYPDMSDDEIRQTLTYSFTCLRLSLADLLEHLSAAMGWWRRD